MVTCCELAIDAGFTTKNKIKSLQKVEYALLLFVEVEMNIKCKTSGGECGMINASVLTN